MIIRAGYICIASAPQLLNLFTVNALLTKKQQTHIHVIALGVILMIQKVAGNSCVSPKSRGHQ